MDDGLFVEGYRMSSGRSEARRTRPTVGLGSLFVCCLSTIVSWRIRYGLKMGGDLRLQNFSQQGIAQELAARNVVLYRISNAPSDDCE